MVCFLFFYSFSQRFVQNLSAKWSPDDQPGVEDHLKNCASQIYTVVCVCV